MNMTFSILLVGAPILVGARGSCPICPMVNPALFPNMKMFDNNFLHLKYHRNQTIWTNISPTTQILVFLHLFHTYDSFWTDFNRHMNNFI